jgi:hypothetical protein
MALYKDVKLYRSNFTEGGAKQLVKNINDY